MYEWVEREGHSSSGTYRHKPPYLVSVHSHAIRGSIWVRVCELTGALRVFTINRNNYLES